jgi:hypothetical protein
VRETWKTFRQRTKIEELIKSKIVEREKRFDDAKGGGFLNNAFLPLNEWRSKSESIAQTC